MSLIAVDLPSPVELRARWAAAAAVLAALGFADAATASKGRWHYDDGGGNWCDLVLRADGRAVLFGHDHEYSETYFRSAATYFHEEETDLLAGAPGWWADQLPSDTEGVWVGFVYGWDDGWSRAPYDLPDGFTSIGLRAVSDENLLDLVRDFVDGAGGDQGIDHSPGPSAVTALGEVGPDLTVDHLRAVFGPVEADLDAGVLAARHFA